MKTSMDIPDELYRLVKSKSALEGRAVRDVATSLFSAWVQTDVAQATSVSASANDHDAKVDAWLETWRQLGSAITAAHGDTLGLVKTLYADREKK